MTPRSSSYVRSAVSTLHHEPTRKRSTLRFKTWPERHGYCSPPSTWASRPLEPLAAFQEEPTSTVDELLSPL